MVCELDVYDETADMWEAVPLDGQVFEGRAGTAGKRRRRWTVGGAKATIRVGWGQLSGREGWRTRTGQKGAVWPRTARGVYDDVQGGGSEDEDGDSGGGTPMELAGGREGATRLSARGDRRTGRASALGLRARQRWEAAWAKRQRMQGMQGKRTCGDGTIGGWDN